MAERSGAGAAIGWRRRQWGALYPGGRGAAELFKSSSVMSAGVAVVGGERGG